MIKKVLIANRSEIACRIINACRELGIGSVAVYSEPDEHALHVKLSDEAYPLGGIKAGESYLDQEKLINAAKETGCDAIHPGYGFLSENHEFNLKVREAGLIFIGPKSESVEILGSKTKSRELMIKNEVPVPPGMKTSSDNMEEFRETANDIGYPVLIKASAGGGGKGMRIVREEKDIISAVKAAARESQAAFGSAEVYLEKYIEEPRHIEFQIAADTHGNYIHLFERECSIQRRHQKVVEETPSTALTPELRKEMGDAAVRAVKAANYDSVGTVEFLLDKNKKFYFLEINTRIQVEHPITEETTGVDLIKLQIAIANNEKLPYSQKELKQNGHSIECRIYAEDPENNFMPSGGKVIYYKEPNLPGVRLDTGIENGTEVPVHYDPILAKLIVHAEDRETAVKKMIIALKNTVILGVKTTIPFLIKVLENENFQSGNTTTHFLEQNAISESSTLLNSALIAADEMTGKVETKESTAGYYKWLNPWERIGDWEING